jgi:hypothetical protein
VEKRDAKRSREAEKEYVRDLANKKKEQSAARTLPVLGGLAALTTSVLESTNAWMFPAQATSRSRDKVSSEHVTYQTTKAFCY